MTDTDIVRIGAGGPAPETGRPGEILEGDPVTTTRNFYADAGGRFFAGVWESTAGKWRVSYTEHEFVHLLAGCVVLTDAEGREQRFGPGDAFVIPAGFAGTWEALEPVRKLYCIYEPG